jgi:hypothetical protein
MKGFSGWETCFVARFFEAAGVTFYWMSPDAHNQPSSPSTSHSEES